MLRINMFLTNKNLVEKLKNFIKRENVTLWSHRTQIHGVRWFNVKKILEKAEDRLTSKY